MSDAQDPVLKFVEAELRKDESVSNEVLQQQASKIAPAIEELSLRQFNARYRLTALREIKGVRPPRRTQMQDAVRMRKCMAIREEMIKLMREAIQAAPNSDDVVEILQTLDDRAGALLDRLEDM